ncbi:MAG: tetratricopeptide repeat protein [Leptospiraceae bacterium]|nr:tetratricopeptide repeat protein [Leptospiraceae bacterium]
MIIQFPNEDFLYRLFPVEKNNREQLVEAIQSYFQKNSIEPKIEITDRFITITFDSESWGEDQKAYRQLVYLSEKGQFKQAKHLALQLIQKSPNVSEYHRILGQIYFEEGNHEDAINCFIDALRWDPENESALLLMGNLFSRYKNDTETAIDYYEQVLKHKPEDYLAMNNVGWNLFLAGKIGEGKKYLSRAIQVKPDFPNSHYALALVADKEGDFKNCFEKALDAVRFNPKKDELYKNSLKLAEDSAKKWIENNQLERLFEDYLALLKKESGTEIRIEADGTIQTPAKIEYAEIHFRDFHLVKYRSTHLGVEHQILHELLHLHLALEARTKGKNHLLFSTPSMKEEFLRSMERTQSLLRQSGVSRDTIQEYILSIFDGINQQIFNTPIDLFIEDRIYQDFLEIRPYQYLSMSAMIEEGILSTTQPEYTRMIPPELVSASKVLNLVMAQHFRELFGRDFVADHKPKKHELALAEKMYAEYLKIRTLKPEGLEYSLVRNWANDLHLENLAQLIPESEYKREPKPASSDEIGLALSESERKIQEEKMVQFLKEHKDQEINAKVSIQMMNALAYYTPLPKSSVKAIAIEFATLGMNGIDPMKEGYSITSIPNKQFSGYEVLAYYYVSWAIALPEHLAELQMPFVKEYELAREFFRVK